MKVIEATPEDQHSQHASEENINAYRSMRDRMHPPRMNAPSCIVPPTKQLVLRPHIVPLLPIFHGMESENPYAHIKEFEEKIFSIHRTNGLKRQISNFSAKENEKFYEYWERYIEAINACPHHGFDTWLLVSYFYNGMSSLMKQLLETMCGGDFMSKNQEEAMDFLSYVAEVSRGWDEPNAREDTDMKAKFVAMARRLEDLEVKKIREVQAISETPVQAISCSICQSFEHLVAECPTILAMREMFGDQANPRAPQYMQPGQAPPQASNLEQAIVNLSKNPKGIHEVEAQEGESSQVREIKVVITLRSDKEVDLPTSKPEHEPESEAEKEKREEIKGKWKGNSTKKEDHEATVNKEPEMTINQEDMMKKHMTPPFSQALHGKKGINNASENLEVLRQVKVNIPLLDMIKQVPTYAKFLNDLCTIKRGLNVSKKAFLTEQVSSIIQCKSPVKYKYPGCPTISVMIEETCVEKALLDLGASVNLLPYSVYKQLGLGELKSTSITLSLADRSVKIPRGMIEDVLVQVDKFYYPVDFVIFDTDPVAKELTAFLSYLEDPS
ncbi:hypothetical protein CK203_061806 [Vitis vinifera]|uniref:Retrotransposon gag domain-containing protein n=1 Tax=Vitis vinifera TaxID=29760 RepID=A0A438GIW0_VITVI|nr:hypothetical protein CK203_061806 [Vitis vinifera]